jgi:hypothetical protein
MKLSAYIVKYDGGFAPNPFGGYCTLACCKPTIRRNAEVDDIIVGTAGACFPHRGYLIYAMRVKEVLTLEKYWDDLSFAARKPTLHGTPVNRRGDNIWHKDANGHWQVVPGACHDERAREKDTGGKNVLIATEFYYFGREAIPVAPAFSELPARTQGHKNTYDEEIISRFWDWLSRTARKKGRIGDPSEFTEEGCRVQCQEIEEDDTTEVEVSVLDRGSCPS